jgi:hypothetical protein
MKKNILIIMGAAVILATGCATRPVTLAPVGPNPMEFQVSTTDGQLEVFSAVTGRGEGNDPTWNKHTDYYLCDAQGRTLEHVRNSPGHYAQRPRLINLPAGKYIVKARGKDMLRADVPVIIQAGETTSVHLDGNWQPPAGTAPTELVYDPEGRPIGWQSGAAR